MSGTYALYAWGNFIHECGIDRIPQWLDPAVLRGERAVVHDSVAMSDEGPLLVDGSRTLFAVDGTWVEGRDLPAEAADWNVGYIRLMTDGSLADAERVIDEMAEQGVDLERLDEPERNPLPFGEVLTIWEDPHGQWDAAIIRL
ncbi:hypothetical protein ACI2K4_04480 [Micromonospora sp. NPDC050397]|uniref:hypothetical protein n=1 Tax=Micromonospora sp. NPDC050397 TaxID=3364279 RepID=UPI00384A5237